MMTPKEHWKNGIDSIDRKRRDLIQTQKVHQDPLVHMYYEGKIQALTEFQAFLEMYDQTVLRT